MKLVYNLGLTGVMSEKIRDIWVFQKSPRDSSKARSANLLPSEALARHQLNIDRIKAATNPPLHVVTVSDARSGKEYTLIDDGHACIGGTKQRLLGRVIKHIPASELVYAGPGVSGLAGQP